MIDFERVRYWALDAPKSKHLGAHRRFDDPEGPKSMVYSAWLEARLEVPL